MKQVVISTVGGSYSISYLQESTVCHERSYRVLHEATKDIRDWINFNQDPYHGDPIHSENKQPEPVKEDMALWIAKLNLLRYSFEPMQYAYEKLTPSERALVSFDQFQKIVAEIKSLDSTGTIDGEEPI